MNKYLSNEQYPNSGRKLINVHMHMRSLVCLLEESAYFSHNIIQYGFPITKQSSCVYRQESHGS